MKSVPFSLLALLLLVSCLSKEKLPSFALPSVSQSGTNTMGFMVDARVWQNYGRRCTTFRPCYDNTLSASYNEGYGGKSFSIGAAATASKVDEFFSLRVGALKEVGVYLSDTIVGAPYNYPTNALTFDDQLSRKYYVSSVRKPSAITITRLDTIAHIVSGTFEGTLYEISDSTQSITISQGRFDMKYSQ